MEKDEKKDKKPKSNLLKRKQKEKQEQIPESDVEVREVIVEKKTGFNTIEVVLIAILALAFGGVVGVVLAYTAKPLSIITNTDSPSDIQEVEKIYDNLLSKYYGEIDKQTLSDAAIKGMIEALNDPYSTYIDAENTDDFDEQIYGYYVGIGTEITLNDENQFEVTNIFENTPATDANIELHDIVVKVNNEDVSGKTVSDIGKLIQGEIGTNVTLTLRRGEEEFDVTITRDRIDLISVTSQIFEKDDKRIGYIKITNFASNTFNQFQTALNELEENDIESLIIDVRDNLGGQLEVATQIASLFLTKDKVVYQLNTNGIIQPIYSTGPGSFQKPITVLINGATASASEVLAIALQESADATVIGTTSYGKGTIQESYKLSTGATIKFTVQEWLSPNGNTVNEVGVKPDIEVSETENPGETDTLETDTVLQTAITIMQNNSSES
ncbi:MAG TPA: S41 family peptidase [Candidatus Faecenecus gallistercoris]|uniref:S41 family peptidase n=1 Tax=Candidatus Faecenecus gallistercoris TaxID=2840793 RepID=A0A9D1CKK0_9FIRM|nr:S41 family peptidase [Candidatus Faecenecus gallistercoris]